MLGNFPCQECYSALCNTQVRRAPEPPCRQSFAQSGSRKQMAAHGAKLQAQPE
jgi:hypothetical protein